MIHLYHKILYNKSSIPGRPESIGTHTKNISHKSINKKIAGRFADFWINRKYIGERPQNIKITEDASSETFQIRLILREDFKSNSKINFEELKLLGQIQHELNSIVFNKKKCELVICDNKFQTINTPIPLYSIK